jgi:hypothetical protein
MNTVLLFVLGAAAFTFACKCLATYVSRREATLARRDGGRVAYGRAQAD